MRARRGRADRGEDLAIIERAQPVKDDQRPLDYAGVRCCCPCLLVARNGCCGVRGVAQQRQARASRAVSVQVPTAVCIDRVPERRRGRRVRWHASCDNPAYRALVAHVFGAAHCTGQQETTVAMPWGSPPTEQERTMTKKQTSAGAAADASDVLNDGRTGADSKTAAGSAISQSGAGGAEKHTSTRRPRRPLRCSRMMTPAKKAKQPPGVPCPKPVTKPAAQRGDTVGLRSGTGLPR